MFRENKAKTYFEITEFTAEYWEIVGHSASESWGTLYSVCLPIFHNLSGNFVADTPVLAALMFSEHSKSPKIP